MVIPWHGCRDRGGLRNDQRECQQHKTGQQDQQQEEDEHDSRHPGKSPPVQPGYHRPDHRAQHDGDQQADNSYRDVKSTVHGSNAKFDRFGHARKEILRRHLRWSATFRSLQRANRRAPPHNPYAFRFALGEAP